jgi:hypothetical protein
MELNCSYCGWPFTLKSNLTRHMEFRCYKRPPKPKKVINLKNINSPESAVMQQVIIEPFQSTTEQIERSVSLDELTNHEVPIKLLQQCMELSHQNTDLVQKYAKISRQYNELVQKYTKISHQNSQLLQQIAELLQQNGELSQQIQRSTRDNLTT